MVGGTLACKGQECILFYLDGELRLCLKYDSKGYNRSSKYSQGGGLLTSGGIVVCERLNYFFAQ